MAKDETLREAFIEELRDTFDAEQQIIKALRKMVKAANSATLRAAFATHLEETHAQVARLEQVFASLDEKIRGKHCDGMAGIIAEAKSIIDADFDDATTDACLVAAAQRVEHYEIAAYGALIAWANVLGHREAASLLEQTLEEEKETDEKLTALADGGINQEAAGNADRDDETTSTRNAAAAKGRSAASVGKKVKKADKAKADKATKAEKVKKTGKAKGRR